MIVGGQSDLVVTKVILVHLATTFKTSKIVDGITSLQPFVVASNVKIFNYSLLDSQSIYSISLEIS